MITLTARSTKPSIIKSINKELNTLSELLENQRDLSDQIFIFLKKYSRTIELRPDLDRVTEIYGFISQSSDQLEKIYFNINSLNQLTDNLNTIKSEIEIIDEKSVSAINKYNDKSNKIIARVESNTSEVKRFIKSTNSLDLSDITDDYITSQTAPETVEAVLSVQDKINAELNSKTFIENTLIISEQTGKIILPYKISVLKRTLMENSDKYSSLQDIVDRLYTKSNRYYHNAIVSRFREAYKLVVEREKGSRRAALDLAFEVAFNSSLHPAIITACKNLNEFDIYLACLEYDELDDFRFFSIKYEMLPTVTSKFKNLFNFNRNKSTNHTIL